MGDSEGDLRVRRIAYLIQPQNTNKGEGTELREVQNTNR